MSGKPSSSSWPWASGSSGPSGSSGRSARFVGSFLLRAVALYALIYLLWLPLQPEFTRLTAFVAERVLWAVDDPPLVTRLAPEGETVPLFTLVTGAEAPLAVWHAGDLPVFFLAPLALVLAVPGASWRSRAKLALPLLLLLFGFCVALAVIQTRLVAELHASSELGIHLVSPSEKSRLERLNEGLHVVGMLALPAFVFLAAYVHLVWAVPDERAAARREPGWPLIAGACILPLAGVGLWLATVRPPPDPSSPEATPAWLRVAELNPGSAPVHVNLGLQLERNDALDEAIESYRLAVRLDPSLAGAHYNLGNALRREGRLEDAAASYRETLTLEPDHAFAHRNLGVTLSRLGRPCEALRHLERSADLDPEFAANVALAGHMAKLRASCSDALR